MLVLFFLQKFYKSFILFFIVFTLIFAISDLLVRLPLLSSINTTPKLFLLMFPLMAQFATPLASCLAIQTVVGSFFIEDEILLLRFFSDARKRLFRAVFIFSLSILFLYIPLIFVWAPKGYQKGKEFILTFAKEQFSQLEPNRFYTLAPGFNFFFKNKGVLNKKPTFEKLLLMVSEKGGRRYIINAKKGFLTQDSLFLEDGVIQNLGSNKYYSATFKQTQIVLDRFFYNGKDSSSRQPLKFLTWKKLKHVKKYMQDAYIEYNKRIAQIIWQLLFPFLALWGIMIFARKKSNLLISVFFSGSLFLFSYISVNSGQVLFKSVGNFALFLFYLPIFFITVVLYFIYWKKR